jgi:hypothetical protein
VLSELNGGGGGIRTHGTLSRTPVFKTGALNRSATPPLLLPMFQTTQNGKGYGDEKYSVWVVHKNVICKNKRSCNPASNNWRKVNVSLLE